MADYDALIRRIDTLENHITARSSYDRVWEILTRLSVPVALVTGATIIAHEVRIGKVEQSVKANYEAIGSRAPATIQENLQDIKKTAEYMSTRLYDMNDRLIRMETTLKNKNPKVED